MEKYRTTSNFLERKGKNKEYYTWEREHPVERRIYEGKKGEKLSTEFFRARTRLSELRKEEEKGVKICCIIGYEMGILY